MLFNLRTTTDEGKKVISIEIFKEKNKASRNKKINSKSFIPHVFYSLQYFANILYRFNWIFVISSRLADRMSWLRF